jgi:hypothetical protein
MECILKNTYPVESEVHHVEVFHKMKCLSADMGILFSETICFLFFILFLCDIHWVRSGYHNEKKKKKRRKHWFLYFYPWSQAIPEITALQAGMVICTVAWIYRILICILAGYV